MGSQQSRASAPDAMGAAEAAPAAGEFTLRVRAAATAACAHCGALTVWHISPQMTPALRAVAAEGSQSSTVQMTQAENEQLLQDAFRQGVEYASRHFQQQQATRLASHET